MPVLKEQIYEENRYICKNFNKRQMADNDWKKRLGVVFSTNPDFTYTEEASEQAKMDIADSLMSIAVKKYKDVYYIRPNATDKRHLAVVDGIHPDNYGYYLWSKSIEKPLLRILRKYGIK